MKTKIWRVSFNNRNSERSYLDTVAPNARCALQKALSKTKGLYYNRLQDVTQIELIAEED